MPLSHDDLLELVRLRMSPLKEGKKMLGFEKLREMRPAFQKLTPVALGEEFVRAFKEDVVDVRAKSVKPPEPVSELGAELVEAFNDRGLSRAIVVKKRDDESLPARLGLAAAYDLDGRLGNGERIGVAAGQTISWLARYVRDFIPIRARRITFVSLTGLFCARQRGNGPGESLLSDTTWRSSHGSNVLIDADINAIRMAQGVQSHVEFVLVANPAVGAVTQTRAQLWKKWLDAGEKKRLTLDRAFVGIGALYHNWRLLDAVNARNPKHPVRQDLEQLKELCKAGAKESRRGCLWWPVFDVANHLMLTEPRDGCGLDSKSARRARDLVQRLNKRVVTIGKNELKATRLYAIAGGRRKSYGIYDAIQRFEIETLVTDEQTATDLLVIHGVREK